MHRKIIFASLFLIITTLSFIPLARADELPSAKDFTVDAKESHAKQKPILVLFMSHSCPYCEIVLKRFLLPMQRDPAFKDRVILRQIETSSRDTLIDFDGKQTTHSAFSAKHKVWGVPHVQLFDSHGQVLTSIVGLLTVDFYYAYLENAIDESQAKIKANSKPTW